MQQLHNARYQSGETIIRYRFHPRYGEAVVVAGRNHHGDEVALLIRQPEGTLAQLPIWMTENQAEAMIVTEHPRLPLAYLFELRRELDACLSLLRDDSRREEGGKHEASPTQSPPIGFFVPKSPPVPEVASEQSKLLSLVSALLSETLGVSAVTEAVDEDHS